MAPGLSSIFSGARIISVGGGKGGVGKSTLAAGIACHLAMLKRRVVLVDADLGGANLHLCMGVRYPDRNLNDFLSGAAPDLAQILISTPFPSVRLLSGAGSLHELTNPRFAQKQKMLSAFRALDADYIVVDVGAGADEDNTDFFSLSDNGIVVLTNEPTSVENGYSFLKNSLLRAFVKLFPARDDLRDEIRRYADPRDGTTRTIDDLLGRIAGIDPEAEKRMRNQLTRFSPRLVLNMVRTQTDVGIAEGFRKIVMTYLGISVTYVGYVVYDDHVPSCIRRIVPLCLTPDAPAVQCLSAITRNLLSLEDAAWRN